MPSPDGLQIGFYKTYWPHLANDVQSIIFQLIEGQIFWEEINIVDLVLIPKIKTSSYPKDFRPISLCNAIYKFVAKILSNRLSTILLSIISENQVAFVKDHLITNVVMVGLDFLYHIHAYKATNNMALKLDMAKAFDRINWSYLYFMLHKFKFPSSFIHIIMYV